MFQNLGLHVISFPTGRFGFRGTVPGLLGTMVPATTDDIMGGRAFTHNGKTVTTKFPSFETREAAIQFAKDRGCEVRHD